MKQLIKEQAILFSKSEIWREWSHEEIVKFQLFQDKLCMDFSRFHEAVEKVFNRPVFIHEFSYNDLLKSEYLGTREKPSFEEIINLIPKEKRIILNLN